MRRHQLAVMAQTTARQPHTPTNECYSLLLHGCRDAVNDATANRNCREYDE